MGLTVARSDGPVRLDRVAEAAQLEGARRLGLDAASGQPVRGLADENLSRRGGLLETRSHVHGLTGGKRRVGLVDHHLARLDTDSRLETEVADMIENPETRADGAVGIVLVRDRDPEGSHHRVAGELFDG